MLLKFRMERNSIQLIDLLFISAIFFRQPYVTLAILLLILVLILLNKIQLSKSPGIYALFAVLYACTIFQLVSGTKFINESLILAFFVYCLTLLLVDKSESSISNLFRLLKLLSIVQILLVFGYFVPDVRDNFYAHSASAYRFRGVFFEPSFAAIWSVFSLLLFLNYSGKSDVRYYVLANVLILILTFSGSGFALMLLTLFLSYKKLARVDRYVLFYFLTIIAGIVFLAFYDSSFVSRRIASSIDGQVGQSTLLRFFAPIEFLAHVFREGDLVNVLVGVGDPRLYIQEFHNDFRYFYIYDGSPTYELNNSYSVFFSMFGLLGLCAYIICIFRYWKPSNLAYNVFFIVLPFFTGHFISMFYIFFWALFMKLNRAHSAN